MNHSPTTHPNPSQPCFWGLVYSATAQLKLMLLAILAFGVMNRAHAELVIEINEPQALCFHLEQMSKVQAQYPYINSPSARSRFYEEVEIPLKSNLPIQIYNQYRLGKITGADIFKCSEQLVYRQDFMNALESSFFNLSVDLLLRSKHPVLQQFAALYHKNVADNTIPFFKLTGHDSDRQAHQLATQDNADPAAGFHRGRESIYLQLDRLNYTRWMVALVHELAHAFDPLLHRAISQFEYISVNKLPEFIKWGEKTAQYTDLTAAQQLSLRQWIALGLDRGIWAEYRAWVLSLQVYRAGVEAQLWPRDEDFDLIWRAVTLRTSLESVVYAVLSKTMPNPLADEPFSKNALLRDAYLHVLQSYDSSTRLPPLGELRRVQR